MFSILLETNTCTRTIISFTCNFSSVRLAALDVKKIAIWCRFDSLPHNPKQPSLDSSKLKDFADKNFEFDENG